MASSAYYTWVSKGKPYVLTKPAKELELLLRGYGYTVYDYPDDDHQTADIPEDHTPYSATEWPVQIVAYVAHAIDIMPPDAAAVSKGAISLPSLARRIIGDRDANVSGTMWIKYMNWTDEVGVCRQESWKTTPRTTKSSTDKGHIHISGRTDTETYSIGGWDPVMASDPQVTTTNYRVFGIQNLQEIIDNHVNNTHEPAPVVTLLKRVDAQVKTNGASLSELLARPAGTVIITPEQIQELADAVAAEIRADMLQTVEEGVRNVLRNGVGA